MWLNFSSNIVLRFAQSAVGHGRPIVHVREAGFVRQWAHIAVCGGQDSSICLYLIAWIPANLSLAIIVVIV